jgi:hypothetical protein
MYLVISKCVIVVKVSNSSGHYLRNRSTLDIGILGYIGIVQHKEHCPEVVTLTRETPCIWGLLCPIHLLQFNKVHAAEYFPESFSSRISSFGIWSLVDTNVLEEEPGSVSTIKMEETTTSNFLVEKEWMIIFSQSTWCHNQEYSNLYRQC